MKRKQNKRSREPKPSSRPAKAASRAGSNAGRGFRYQDAVSAWLAVEIWAGQRTPAIVIPEGGDDIELRGEVTSFVQVKSRREHLGDYTEGETVGHIEDLWNRSLGSAPRIPPAIGKLIRGMLIMQSAFCTACISVVLTVPPVLFLAALLLIAWPVSRAVSRRFYAS